jgi:hypothetical protein
MSAAQLKQLLAKGSMVSDNLRDTIVLCDDWYAAEPSLATFVLRSIFRDLERRGWDDQQGVSTAVYDPFKNGVVPRLMQIADILIATPAAEPIDELDDLVVAYRDSVKATP